MDRETRARRPKTAAAFFNKMHKAAMVYDWCYDLLTNEEKDAFIREFITFLKEDHHRGYPPNVDKALLIVGHDNEGWIMTNMIPAGLAAYDEFPEIYEHGCDIFFNYFVPVREVTYKGRWHHQGTHYSGERSMHDAATAWLFRRIGTDDVLPADLHYVPYELLYSLRPDNKCLMVGDDNDDYCRGFDKRLFARLVGTYYDDPYLLTYSDMKQFHTNPFFLLFDILFLEPGAKRSPLSDLPDSWYSPEPAGQIIARTGWEFGADSPTAMALMRIGNLYFGNHHHRDFGTFQLYYKGPLALDTGLYQGRGKNVVSSD